MTASTADRLGRPFWTMVVSSGLSNLADGVYKLALPLVAIHFTRSPALVAGLELVRTLPWLVSALPVGALADRLDRRRTMVWANTARALFAIVPAIAISSDIGTLWLLYVAAIGTGIAEVFYDTSAQSILPSIVPRSRLDRANGRLYAVELGAQEFAGPPLAGALVAAGLALSFSVSAGLWVLALAALTTLTGSFRPTRQSPQGTIRADIRDGLSFLRRKPVVARLALMVGMTNLATSATFPMLVLFAVGPESTMGLSEPQFGFLIAAVATGGAIGGLVGARVSDRLGRKRTLTVSLLGMITFVATPALTAEVTLIAAALFLGGLTIMTWNVITVSFRQRVTPDHLLGRVNSTYRLVAWGTLPLGAGLAALLGELVGVRAVFAIMGLFSLSVLIPNRGISEEALAEGEAS